MKPTRLTRRRMLAVALATGGLAAVGSTPALAALQIATPRQTAGPFYPTTKPLDQDSDLTIIAGKEGIARGTPLHLTGRVVDRDGRPQPGAVVEIWQANAHGRYHIRASLEACRSTPSSRASATTAPTPTAPTGS